MNSNCDQQVDVDWINVTFGMNPKQRDFLCDLTIQ